MSEYRAPLAEMRFVMTELAGLEALAELPGFEDATPDTKIETARHFADHVLTRAAGLHDTVVAGAGSVLALAEGQF